MQRVERLSVEDVSLEVQHCGPDPHGREHLDYREPPVGEQQLDSFEQHDKGTADYSERCEDAPATAQLKDRGLDRGVVALVDGADQPRIWVTRAARRETGPAAGRSSSAGAGSAGPGPSFPTFIQAAPLLDRRIR